MNLLPNTEKEELKRGLKLRALIASSILAAAAFLAGFVLLWPSYFLAIQNFSRSEKESQSLTVTNDESVKSILKLPSEINSKLKFFKSNEQNILASKYLNDILKFRPQEVKLDSVSFVRGQTYNEKKGTLVALSGTASNREALVSFSNLLKNSDMFSVVDIPVSNLTKDKNLPFSINVLIENSK